MDRRKATDYPQELLNLYDQFAHGDIQRREFLESAKKFAVGSVTAAMLLEGLSPNFAWAEQIPKTDARIRAEQVTVNSPEGHGTIKGYLARPASSSGKLPGVLVIHENRGLNPYIEDVVRRLAVANFVAFAPDGLTTKGGYPGDEDQGRALFAEIDRDTLMQDFLASARWLNRHPECTGKTGVVGFCFGAGIANNLAARLGNEIAAAVPYYGGQARAEDVPGIQAPLQLHYASLDTRVNAGWPAYEQALKANGKRYTVYHYQDVNHGFHNDTTPRFDEEAAKLAWSRTVAFFNENLR